MCIAYLSLGHPGWPLLIAANRDEYHRRPAVAAAPWPGHPDLIAGRDLEAGGTWLGHARGGRHALLTNYREPGRRPAADAPSRGVLVRDFLLGEDSAQRYVEAIAAQGQDWAGFNLIVGDAQQTWYYGNRDPAGVARRLDRGTYVLSNHLLDTPWPKAARLRARLSTLSADQWARNPDRVFALLRDTQPAADDMLPETGLPLELERRLSSPFIISPEYGTRCSTVLAVATDGTALFSELTYDPAGCAVERHDWRVPGRAAPEDRRAR
jgi:uncharacterized protein with NRDE domain